MKIQFLVLQNYLYFYSFLYLQIFLFLFLCFSFLFFKQNPFANYFLIELGSILTFAGYYARLRLHHVDKLVIRSLCNATVVPGNFLIMFGFGMALVPMFKFAMALVALYAAYLVYQFLIINIFSIKSQGHKIHSRLKIKHLMQIQPVASMVKTIDKREIVIWIAVFVNLVTIQFFYFLSNF